VRFYESGSLVFTAIQVSASEKKVAPTRSNSFAADTELT